MLFYQTRYLQTSRCYGYLLHVVAQSAEVCHEALLETSTSAAPAPAPAPSSPSAVTPRQPAEPSLSPSLSPRRPASEQQEEEGEQRWLQLLEGEPLRIAPGGEGPSNPSHSEHHIVVLPTPPLPPRP